MSALLSQVEVTLFCQATTPPLSFQQFSDRYVAKAYDEYIRQTTRAAHLLATGDKGRAKRARAEASRRERHREQHKGFYEAMEQNGWSEAFARFPDEGMDEILADDLSEAIIKVQGVHQVGWDYPMKTLQVRTTSPEEFYKVFGRVAFIDVIEDHNIPQEE
jgi:predicted glycosyl hydrolase (DUF1957 family)